MWNTLCNFLCNKLFYRQRINSRLSRNDHDDSKYGKRIKLSNDCDTRCINKSLSSELFQMKSSDTDKINNSEDDESECCVIAEIPRRRKNTSNVHTINDYKSSIIPKGNRSSPNFDKALILQDEKKDIEVVKCNSKGTLKEKCDTIDKNFKFFHTQRASFSQSKAARSKLFYRNNMKRKLNFLQESYRLTEKYQYMQLLQSHTTYNLLALKPPFRKAKYAPTKIPIIDLTDDRPGIIHADDKPGINLTGDKSGIDRLDDKPRIDLTEEKLGASVKDSRSYTLNSCKNSDADIQIVGEIPRVRSFEEFLKVHPANGRYVVEGLLSKHQKNNADSLENLSLKDKSGFLVECNEKKSGPDVLEEKLRTFMQITNTPGQESGNDSEQQYFLPPLSREQEKNVQAALILEPRNEILTRAFGLQITRQDMQTLKGLNWLNDEIINFYMSLIMDRSKRSNSLPKIYAFNTFFYTKLVSNGYTSLRRWTKQVDIFSYDIILVPIHLGMHWCVSVIDFRLKSIQYYDSVGSPNNSCLDRLLLYLKAESLDKKKKIFPTSDWEKVNVEDIPQQMNGSDCGVFSCMFAEHLARDSAILFTQNDMPYFRKKMVIEILEGRLLT